MDVSPPPRVRLVSCDALPEGDEESRFLAGFLTARGWEVDIAAWSDPDVAWENAPLTVIRSTWDYPARLDGFLDWLDRTSRFTTLHNPAPMVRGNVDKRYLLDLADRGVPVLPTVWLPRVSAEAVDRVRSDRGWEVVVVKPTVGLDGEGVHRLGRGEAPIPVPPRPTGHLVQPYAPSVREIGETSVCLFDGVPAYATLKRPPARAGAFLVQERWGGASEPAALEDATADRAQRALLEAVGPDTPAPLYARVDLVEFEGTPHVAEVELVEPSLYLLDDPARAAAFADALDRRRPA